MEKMDKKIIKSIKKAKRMNKRLEKLDKKSDAYVTIGKVLNYFDGYNELMAKDMR